MNDLPGTSCLWFYIWIYVYFKCSLVEVSQVSHMFCWAVGHHFWLAGEKEEGKRAGCCTKIQGSGAPDFGSGKEPPLFFADLAGWWFYFYFLNVHLYLLEDSHEMTNIVQMGWFNHHFFVGRLMWDMRTDGRLLWEKSSSPCSSWVPLAVQPLLPSSWFGHDWHSTIIWTMIYIFCNKVRYGQRERKLMELIWRNAGKEEPGISLNARKIHPHLNKSSNSLLEWLSFQNPGDSFLVTF